MDSEAFNLDNILTSDIPIQMQDPEPSYTTPIRYKEKAHNTLADDFGKLSPFTGSSAKQQREFIKAANEQVRKVNNFLKATNPYNNERRIEIVKRECEEINTRDVIHVEV